MTDLVTRIEKNRFTGREFLLWLWFESILFETNLQPTGQPSCALWLETRLALNLEKDDSLLKSQTPGTLAEAREALRQGKLPREARLRMVIGEREYAWLFKAEALSIGSLTIQAELDLKKDEVHEVLYERMRIVEQLEAVLEALWSDFLALRLSEAWESAALPAMRAFAHDQVIDIEGYTRAKLKAAQRGRLKGEKGQAELRV